MLQDSSKPEKLKLDVRCDFCGTESSMTLVDVADDLEIKCSVCGGPIGMVGQLRRDSRNERS